MTESQQTMTEFTYATGENRRHRRHSPSDETGHGRGRDPGNAGSALSKTVIILKV